MFEVPAAKRVKRSELFNSDDEVGDHNSKQQGTRNQSLNGNTDRREEDGGILPNYGFEYDFISPGSRSISGPDTHEVTTAGIPKSTKEDSETYQFNLFAPIRLPKSTEPLTQPATLTTPDTTSDPQAQPQPLKISIRSPSPIPETTGPGSLTHSRPLHHYLTSALPPSILQSRHTSYLSSAISPATLLKLSALPWPGTHQPWRIITLPAHRKQIVIVKSLPGSTATSTKPMSTTTMNLPSTIETAKPRRRPRPSKKRRDLTRSKAQKRQAIIDESKTKEEHEREKRNKKNRERKLKRRAKERREKEGKSGGNGGDGTGEGQVEGRDASVSVNGTDD